MTDPWGGLPSLVAQSPCLILCPTPAVTGENYLTTLPWHKYFIQNYFRLIEPGDPSERINPQPCVPSVVTTCIRWEMKNIFKAKDNKIYLQISWASWAQYCWHFPSELQSEESETVERGLWQWSWCDLDGWSQCSRCRVHSQGILSWPSWASAAPRGVSATSSNSK